jgi:hypothetical protein
MARQMQDERRCTGPPLAAAAQTGLRVSAARSGDRTLFVRVEQLYLHRRHHGRDGMFIDQLGMSVAPQQNGKLIEPRDNALQLDAIDKEDSNRRFILADIIEEYILYVL